MKKIFDPLRKKNVALTPEEEVRQLTIKALAESAGVPMTHMESEWSFKFNGLQYRADIVVFDRSLKPVMLVECKAPSVKLSQMTIDQTIRYNFVLKVRYILITNGKTSYLCRLDEEAGAYMAADSFPTYEKMISDDRTQS